MHISCFFNMKSCFLYVFSFRLLYQDFCNIDNFVAFDIVHFGLKIYLWQQSRHVTLLFPHQLYLYTRISYMSNLNESVCIIMISLYYIFEITTEKSYEHFIIALLLLLNYSSHRYVSLWDLRKHKDNKPLDSVIHGRALSGIEFSQTGEKNTGEYVLNLWTCK